MPTPAFKSITQIFNDVCDSVAHKLNVSASVTIDNTDIINKLEEIRLLLVSTNSKLDTIATNTTNPITVVTE